MKYIANPVEVDAFKIVEVLHGSDMDQMSTTMLRLEDGRVVSVESELMARFLPNVEDYYVVQSDGYVYLNPKDVFERKYHRKEESAHA